MSGVFFGYPEHPRSQAEVCERFSAGIRDRGVPSQTWQDNEVSGRVVMRSILELISASEFCVFDVTRPNENVLFELGYAIARAKPIWMIADRTVAAAKQNWRDLGLLTRVGYTGYQNSAELLKRFDEHRPIERLTPLYDQIIDPLLPDEDPGAESLFYRTTFDPFEASNRLSHVVDDRRRRGLSVVVSDPTESSFDTLDWFAPKIVSAGGVLIHFAGAARTNARVQNWRNALIAGFAVGFEVPTLLLAEEDYAAPFDYEDLLTVYETSDEAVTAARQWIDGLTFRGIRWARPRAELRSRLFGLRFGEHVAENELNELSEYFVETSAFSDVVEARDTIFVGHRGTGKTANALEAFEYVSSKKSNLAVLIKPPGFEFPSLLSALGKVPEAQHDYLFDTLWRFVIQTEIAAAAYTRILDRPSGVPLDVAEETFIAYVESAPFQVGSEMSVRLEQALSHLLSQDIDLETAESGRHLINEAFHLHALAELRHRLGPVLKSRQRVAVFIDNLDKGWEARADLRVLARLILGLLTARGRLATDFSKTDSWRDEIKLTIAIFLRSDIFNYLKAEAREPDKLPLATIKWNDRETLLAVVENRFLVSQSQEVSAAALWTDYFPDEVRGVPAKDYLCEVVLPRPRDIVYFCNSAVGRAIDRRHDRVTEEDLLSAEETYSKYAYEALLVENGVTIPEMTEALLTLLGEPSVRTRAEIEASLLGAGLDEVRATAVLNKLIAMSVLGVETHEGSFEYPEVGIEAERALALAQRLQPVIDQQRLRLHRAFWSFLGTSDETT